MSNLVNSFVNKSEAEALKTVIFRRVQERNEVLNEQVQSDVMDLARDSFVSKNNPFSRIIETSSAKETTETAEIQVDTASETTTQEVEEIGFPIKNSGSRMLSQSRLINEQMTSAAVASSMQDARSSLENKRSFMGALNFLNAQAAVSLARTRSDRFEFLA